MNKKDTELNETERTKRLVEELCARPLLRERVEAILKLVRSDEGPIAKADDIEELLVQEMRKLGHNAMQEWATRAEARSVAEFQQDSPAARCFKKKVLSWWCLYGLVTVEERVWRTPRVNYLRVFNAQAGISPRGKSRPLERVLCDFGAESSFAKSCLRLKEHYGFELGPSAVRKSTLHHAARAEKKLAAHYAENFRALPKKGPAQIIAQTDGTMIRTVPAGRKRKDKRLLEWKEMRLSAACAQGSRKVHYAAGFTNVEETGRRMAHCARAAGWALESRIHLIADGAEWIGLQAKEVFGEQCDFLLDFYHVSEYLAAAAPSCRPGDEKGWLRTQQKRLKRGASAQVLQTMSEHEESARTPEEQAPVRAAIRYLSRRREQLDYKAALAKELPIGSGLIESGHKHVLQARLKQTGSAWNPHNAHALAQLRVLRSNSLWDDFWASNLAA